MLGETCSKRRGSKYKVLSDNMEFKIPAGRPLPAVPVSTAAQTATKCPVS
jgi:hypothetical protein